MNNTELLNCPLCGDSVEIHEIEPHTHSFATFMPDCKGEAIIECKCGLSIMRDTVEELVEAWNTRKPMERILEQLESKISPNVDMDTGEPCNNWVVDMCNDLIAECIEIVKAGGVHE